MPNVIRIKRRSSGVAGAPSSLSNAELAFNEIDDTLYYGKGDNGSGGATSIVAIGGSGTFATKTYVDTAVSNATVTGVAYLAQSNTFTAVNTFSATSTIDIAGAWKIDGSTVNTSAAELNVLDGVTLGTVSASKAVVVDSNKDITGFRNLTAGVTGSTSTVKLSNTTTGNVIEVNDTSPTTVFSVDYTGAVSSVSLSTTGNAGVGGDLTVTGNLTVNGTTTTVNSTVVTVDDPLITVGGDTAPTTDDNKDRGVAFRWHTGSAAKIGFFGYDDSSGYFTFVPDATITSEVVSGTVGTINVGGVFINGSQISASALSNGVTGTGSVVLATGPTITTATLVTPALGTPTSGTLTNCTGLPISTGVSGLGTGVATFLATPSSANLAAAVTDETGTGALVFATSPTLVTPALGTPTSGTLTNCTGLPISTGVSGLGTNVATFLATPSSANLASAVTDETGSGALVFGTSPTITTPTITFSTSAAVTAGTNAQGQGALTSDYDIITTAANNPSGVTLPTATVGRRVIVVNKGANPINVYPATGAAIDALAANASVQIPVAGLMVFNASSTTQWYSTGNSTFTAPALGTPVSGTLTNCTGLPVSTGVSGLGTGVATFLATPSSANLISAVTDETGTGSLVFATSPTLVTPVLGTPTSGTLTNCTGLPISTGVSGLGTGVATFLATPSSANLISAVTDETGTGSLVFATSPTLVTPVLGTPTSGTLTNCTGLPISTGVSGLGTGVATFLATPSSANLISAVTDETGTGSLVFGTSPAFTTSVTTGSTTFAVFNTTATTVNAFGAATAISMGASTGTTTVNNNLTVTGNLTINGTTTTVNSTTVTIDDPIFTLGGDTAPASDDNKDRGVEFRWHNGTAAKVGFFGYDDSASVFTFIPDATNTSEVFAGTAGDVAFGKVNNVTITTPASAATFTLGSGKTFTVSNTLTFTGTDSSSVAFGAGGTVAYTGSGLNQFAATTSAQLAGVISDETGSGALVFATSPTLVTPLLGTPTSGTLTNCTGLPISTGVSGLGTGVATFLATPSSANLASAVTDETGSGALVFGTSPAFTTSVTTGSTTFALFNTTATTVNAFGAATAINMGASTGTTTINNDLALAGGKSLKLTGSTSGTLTISGPATAGTNTISFPAETGTVVTTASVCTAIANCTLDGGTF